MQSLREKIDVAMRWSGLALFFGLLLWFIDTAKLFWATGDIATGIQAIIVLLIAVIVMTMSMQRPSDRR